MKKFFILRGLGFLVLGAAAVTLVGFVVMSLWNWLIPALFAGPVINFCQAIGLFILSKILFSGFGRRGCCGHGGHRGFWKRKMVERWKGKMEEKLSKMSPEEREKFKSNLRNKCSYYWDDKTEGKNENKTNDGTEQ